jgi:hypothetical protein
MNTHPGNETVSEAGTPLGVAVARLAEVREALRAHNDHLRAGEDHTEVPNVQGHEGRAAIRRLHGADEEEELIA